MGCFNSKKVEGGDAYKKETAPAPTPAPAPKPAPVSQPPVASSESKLTPVAESPSTAGKPPTTESSKEEKKPSKEEAPDKPTGQDKEAQPEKEPEVTAPTSQASQPEDDHAKYASKYSVWDKAFKDEAGEKMKLGQKEVRKLFKKVLPGMSQTVFDLLYETVKKDDNGSINFIDFSRIGEAFVKKDSSGFPTVDPEKFRKIIDDDKALREKTRGSITEGAKSGELATILKSLDIKPEGSNKEDEYKRLVKVYPNWKTLFDAADADQKGGLGLDQLKKVLRSLGSFSNKQMKILYYSMDEDGNGTIDYCEFCWMAEALLEGKVNSEQFGGVDPENFRQAMSEAKELRGKVRSNLIAGLKSGQLKSLVATVPGDDKEKKKPKAVELTPVGEELREKYPVWWEHFCNADSDKTGELSLKSLRNLCRKEFEKLPQKQLRALRAGELQTGNDRNRMRIKRLFSSSEYLGQTAENALGIIKIRHRWPSRGWASLEKRIGKRMPHKYHICRKPVANDGSVSFILEEVSEFIVSTSWGAISSAVFARGDPRTQPTRHDATQWGAKLFIAAKKSHTHAPIIINPWIVGHPRDKEMSHILNTHTHTQSTQSISSNADEYFTLIASTRNT